MLFYKFVAALFVAAQCALGFPGFEIRQNPTCSSREITTTYVSTITSVATLPYPCYTKTWVTARTGKGCPDLATCPPAIMCIVITTTTVVVPPFDKCCPKTSTLTTPGTCQSCQTGCATSTDTTWLTATASYTLH